MRWKVVREVDNEATGAEWRMLREQAGVSLRNLAQTMGVSAPYLSDLERGRRNWTEELENRPPGRQGPGPGGLQGQQGNRGTSRARAGQDEGIQGIQGIEGGHPGPGF
jgi:DNA-binding XRE family transcriptional regulator